MTFAFLDCTTNPELTENALAVISLLDISKGIGASVYPFIAGAGFLIGISKVL
jgi:hypothetical protein